MADRTLSKNEARTLYDRVGRWQDTQQFYERPALDVLLTHADFEHATSILEVGCGTGRFATRVLREHAPSTARYEGLDLSGTMVQIARKRLASLGKRATVMQTDGALTFERPEGAQDRIVATYLLDLLPRAEARIFLAEAHRLLRSRQPPGRLCLAGLTRGAGPVSRSISVLWDMVHALRPQWVGGCRPIRIRPLLQEEKWREMHHAIVTAWGVPSEVLIAAPA